MDLTNLPEDFLEMSSALFVDGIEHRTKHSIEFIQTKYVQKETFYKALIYMKENFINMMDGDLRHYELIGNSPINEAWLELQHSVNHALIGSYKAAFADLRRSIELTLTIPFYTKENFEKYSSLKESTNDKTDLFKAIMDCLNEPDNLDTLSRFNIISNDERKKANDWINGDTNTPFFSAIIKELIKEGRFKNINENHQWAEKLTSLYHTISDFVHNKGYKKSYYYLNSHSTSFVSDVFLPSINLETLGEFVDCYIETVKQNIVTLTLYNPKVLEGLPIEQKFGFNEPASGFFSYYESELLWELLPVEYHNYFHEVRTTDSAVLDVVKYVMERPDVTQEEYNQQIESFNVMIKDLTTPKG